MIMMRACSRGTMWPPVSKVSFATLRSATRHLRTPIGTAEERRENADSAASSLAMRFIVTAEVCASKIGPAGAGWWAANAYACQVLGFAATDLGYFVTTGLGDAGAVFTGHCAYFLLKSLAVPNISMAKEVQTATFLACATFLSGFVWQPMCNALADAPFWMAASGVGAACGSAFFVGLRGGRSLLPFPAVEGPTLGNLRDDFTLSAAIGGATGTFVGVVVDFADNPFIGTSIGILATASTASGCFSSSQATILGFSAVQALQNMTFPRKTNWIDGCIVEGTYKTG